MSTAQLTTTRSIADALNRGNVHLTPEAGDKRTVKFIRAVIEDDKLVLIVKVGDESNIGWSSLQGAIGPGRVFGVSASEYTSLGGSFCCAPSSLPMPSLKMASDPDAKLDLRVANPTPIRIVDQVSQQDDIDALRKRVAALEKTCPPNS